MISSVLRRLCEAVVRLPVCVVLAWVTMAAPSQAQSSAAGLPEPVAQALASAGIPTAQVGLQVVAVDDAAALTSLHAGRAFNPASIIKILATYAALLRLGDDYRWQTRFYLDGPLDNGTLAGDLVLVGGGDPKLVIEHLLELLAQMRAAGLQRITGDLRLDNALYAPAQKLASFDGQDTEPYNVRPDAAMLNFKSTKFVVQPGRRSAALVLDPPLAGVELRNRIRLADGRCRYRANGLRVREFATAEPVIEVAGRYSRRCGQGHAFHAVLDHVRFSGALFRAAWQQLGGQWDGRARRDRAFQPATSGLPWLVWSSPHTLADIVTGINKFSNNVMTRQVVLQMAAEQGEPVVDEAAGRRQVVTELRLQGLALRELVLDNGSGLSRKARVSPAGLVAALVHAARGPYRDTLRESFPVVGVDGTMRFRLRGHALAGRAWIKTGSLADVRSMAGYLDARSGRRYALAMMVNGPAARASGGAQDALLRWIYENG